MKNDKQRDRLVELIIASVNGCARNWAEVIADYLLANGAIVPPCWIGDKIYFVCGCNIAEYTVERINYDLIFWQFHCENPAYAIEHREFSFFDERIGKTVFLSREEAEKALGGVQG